MLIRTYCLLEIPVSGFLFKSHRSYPRPSSHRSPAPVRRHRIANRCYFAVSPINHSFCLTFCKIIKRSRSSLQVVVKDGIRNASLFRWFGQMMLIRYLFNCLGSWFLKYHLVKDWRRMNVSFTRARSKLIIIGSRKMLQSTPLPSHFFTHGRQKVDSVATSERR
jgi:hypothetical protein